MILKTSVTDTRYLTTWSRVKLTGGGRLPDITRKESGKLGYCHLSQVRIDSFKNRALAGLSRQNSTGAAGLRNSIGASIVPSPNTLTPL